ncbi:SPOR domain-containing protein [Psychromarinibacter sp. C21-152]|uniref:SPOR domain-containing protein n=1 Tax=Psychromarinibacter sediminicola TaxID=3033385 RepID=A0AAE3NPX5_9RHOB|nr:SPOR domain-containing protein [Psychromarinibacter sediminicola]MDF0601363.1 SPOR domain-containing protein [Psychromarinibacter sediminicola]
MADLYLGAGAEPDPVSRGGLIGAVLTWSGALMSVALIGGLGLWGYQLAVRDMTGVPVVRALEGPMRVTPDDPGGEQADHQGLAVNNVAAEGVAEGPADRLVLAPPPLDLEEEDQSPATAAGDDTGDDAGDDAGEGPDMLALADEMTEGVTPLSAPIESPEMAEEHEPIQTIPESVPGVARSVIPRPRPARLDATAEAVAESVAGSVNATPVEVDPAEVTSGTRLVQFGAYASADEARAAWGRMDERFTDFLTDKKRVIEKAVSGGKTFYRLRAMGFADISDARRFCSAFVAQSQPCIPVVAR